MPVYGSHHDVYLSQYEVVSLKRPVAEKWTITSRPPPTIDPMHGVIPINVLTPCEKPVVLDGPLTRHAKHADGDDAKLAAWQQGHPEVHRNRVAGGQRQVAQLGDCVARACGILFGLEKLLGSCRKV